MGQDGLFAAHDARDHGAGVQPQLDVLQPPSDDQRIGHAVSPGHDVGVEFAAVGFEGAFLLSDVDFQDPRQEFDEENHADHAERIGDPVGDGGVVAGHLPGGGEPRGAGQRAGQQPCGVGGVQPADVCHGEGGEGGGQNKQCGESGEALSFALEGAEESGAGLYPDGEDEEGHPEVSEFGRHDDAEVAEEQGDEDNGRDVQGDPFDVDAPDDEAEGDDDEEDENRRAE